MNITKSYKKVSNYTYLCRLIFNILFLINTNTLTYSQKTFLKIFNSGIEKLPENLNFKTQQPDSISTYNTIKSVINQLTDKGYASVIIDSLIKTDNIFNVYLNLGHLYKWANVSMDYKTRQIFEESGCKTEKLSNNIFRYGDIKYLSEKVLTYLENNGYPLSSFYLDSIDFINPGNKINAIIKINKGPLITIDSIYINKDAGISKSYIYSYIGIKPGDKYKEEKITGIDKKLKELDIIKLSSPTETIIRNDKATIHINVQKGKVSDFTGIIGFMPDNTDNKKLLINGEISLNLINILQYGETVSINWRKTDPLSQQLKTSVEIPYIFNTHIGVDDKLNILKKDTTYLNINNRFGIKYMISYTDYCNAYYESKQSKLINTKGMKNISELPQYADINTNYYGIEFYKEWFNYRNNPIKGYSFLVNLSTGMKKIKKNQNINPEVYNNIDLNTTQYRIEEHASVFLPIGGKNTIGLFNKSGLLNGNGLFANELFRIGGFNTLRGFNEDAIYASAFSIFTCEYRYLLDEDSYIQIFCDGAYYETKTVNMIKYDTPYGLGIGITFSTKAGMFSLNYATGSEHGKPLNLNSFKIHFGIKGKL